MTGANNILIILVCSLAGAFYLMMLYYIYLEVFRSKPKVQAKPTLSSSIKDIDDYLTQYSPYQSPMVNWSVTTTTESVSRVKPFYYASRPAKRWKR